MDGTTITVIGVNIPIYLALAGIYYKQGKLETKIKFIEKNISTRMRFRK